MSNITAILTAWKRPTLLRLQFEAIRSQSVAPNVVWLWANEPDVRMLGEIEGLQFDRVVTCSDNAGVHARFALALTAPTECVAIFDDDAVPGSEWFANCLRVMTQSPGILGSAGVRLQGDRYRDRTLHGWHDPSAAVVEVDLVGHAWFLRTEWVRHLFAAPALVSGNGEDIELAGRAWRLGGVRSFCPPHPADHPEMWGSVRGAEFGQDAMAASRRPTHLDERDQAVQAEVAAGWVPLYRRKAAPVAAATAPMSSAGDDSLLTLVPSAARRILEIGCERGDFGAAVKARQSATVLGLTDARSAETAKTRLDDVQAGDMDELTTALAPGSFDCIICRRPETLRDPEKLFRRFPGLLADGGRVIACFPNVRHHGVVSDLLRGFWRHEPGGVLERDHIRFFTRREMEKLLYRAGLHLAETHAIPGPGYLIRSNLR